ncbi:MAG: hypothetical protein ACKO8I_01960 [Cyanobacteriota bacterium]
MLLLRPLRPVRPLLPLLAAALLVPLPWRPAAAQPATTERADSLRRLLVK